MPTLFKVPPPPPTACRSPATPVPGALHAVHMRVPTRAAGVVGRRRVGPEAVVGGGGVRQMIIPLDFPERAEAMTAAFERNGNDADVAGAQARAGSDVGGSRGEVDDAYPSPAAFEQRHAPPFLPLGPLPAGLLFSAYQNHQIL